MFISAALSAPTGRAGGGPAGIPGNGGFGLGLIAAGGPAREVLQLKLVIN